MPIKNYTTKVPVNQTLNELQQILVRHGATGIMMNYEKGTGRIESLLFRLDLHGKEISFCLPSNWRAFQAVLRSQNVQRSGDDDYCYRVAWRCVFHWVEAQMALFETEMVQLTQVFLPYAMARDGKTVFEKMVSDPKLLIE